MSDSTQNLDTVSTSSSQKEVQANALFDAASPATIYGRRASTCSALVFGYYGGRFNGTSVANGTVTATASNTNYVVAHRTTLIVSISTASTNWNDTGTYGRLYKLTAGSSSITAYEDHRAGSGGMLDQAVPAVIQVAASDESSPLTTGTAKLTFRMPHAMTLTAVRASLTTTSSSGTPTIDINEGGTTILSTKITVDVGEKTSTTAAVPPVISDSALADDAEITIDIDVAGTGAAGLKVTLIGTRP